MKSFFGGKKILGLLCLLLLSVGLLKAQNVGSLGGTITDQAGGAVSGAKVTITDLAGDNDHFAAMVTSAAFKGKTRVQQHQMVYAALKGRMGGELHALSLQTAAKD